MYIKARVIGDEEITRKFGNTPARMARLRDATANAARIVQVATAAATPRDTGEAADSWQTDVRIVGTLVVGLVGSPLMHAVVLEHGRGAGETAPPLDAIAPWAARHLPGVDPFVVARSIGAKGFAGKHMLRNALAATYPARRALMSQTVSTLVEAS